MAAANSVSSSPITGFSTTEFSEEQLNSLNKLGISIEEILSKPYNDDNSELDALIEGQSIRELAKVKHNEESNFNACVDFLCSSLDSEYTDQIDKLSKIIAPKIINTPLGKSVKIKQHPLNTKDSILKVLQEINYEDLEILQNEPKFQNVWNLLKIYIQIDEFKPLEQDPAKRDNQLMQRSKIFKNLIESGETEILIRAVDNLPEHERDNALGMIEIIKKAFNQQ